MLSAGCRVPSVLRAAVKGAGVGCSKRRRLATINRVLHGLKPRTVQGPKGAEGVSPGPVSLLSGVCCVLHAGGDFIAVVKLGTPPRLGLADMADESCDAECVRQYGPDSGVWSVYVEGSGNRFAAAS